MTVGGGGGACTGVEPGAFGLLPAKVCHQAVHLRLSSAVASLVGPPDLPRTLTRSTLGNELRLPH